MNMRVAGLVNDSIVDGPGFRFAIFAQGCPHACPGCHNPQTHDFAGGQDMDTDEIIARFRANPLLDGITLTGGDPFCQPRPCAALARAAHESGLTVWAYTGYLYEETLRDPEMRALLREVDVLIDGPSCFPSARSRCAFAARKISASSTCPPRCKGGAVVEKNI